jgi:hypothetical protein
LVGAFTTVVSLRKITVVAEYLKPIGVVMLFQPPVYSASVQIKFSAVGCAIVGDMVDAEKWKVGKPTTGTLSSVFHQHCFPPLLPKAPRDGSSFLGVLFSPSEVMRPQLLPLGVIVFQIISPVSRFLSAFSFLGWQFLTHRNIIQ